MAKRIFAPAVTALAVLALLLLLFADPSTVQAGPAETTALAVPVEGGAQDSSEEPVERLPTTGDSLPLVALVGGAALLTGAIVAVAVRGRRRLLRGAAYW